MSNSKAKISNNFLQKGRRKISKTGQSHSPLGKGTVTQLPCFYGPAVDRFVARKPNRIVEPQSIILFSLDKSLDDTFLQNNLNPKEAEAKKIFANYRRKNS
jgi:hypothetical protein